MTRKAPILLLMFTLLASLAVNFLLIRQCLSLYRDQMEVRLNPIGRPDENSAASKPVRLNGIVYLGDSRIAMWSNLPTTRDIETINRGIGGETTAQMLRRIERDVLPLQPAVVVIQCGVNDLKAIGLMPHRRQEFIDHCSANLWAAVNELRSANALVIVTTIWPCGKPDVPHMLIWSDDVHEARKTVNRELLSWKLPGVEIVDCDDLLANADLVKPELALDHLHLNSFGYERLASRVQGAVIRALNRD